MTATADRSGDAAIELLGDGGFELLRRVPGIRTGRRVSFDASLGRASTDDDATGGSGAAAQSPTASSESPEGFVRRWCCQRRADLGAHCDGGQQ